jgi:hypothetical protein
LKKIFFLIIAGISLSHFGWGQAQIEVKSSDEWARVKNDTTFILMDSVDDTKNDVYKKVFTNNWKLSHIQFIDVADFERNLSPNASYISLVYPVTDAQIGLTASKYNPAIPDAANELMMANEETFNLMAFKLWTCNDRYFKKQNKWNMSFVKEIAAVKLYADMTSIIIADKQSHSAPKADAKEYATKMQEAGGSVSAPYVEGEGAYIFNWGPGIVKNYLQIFAQLLSTGVNGGIVVNSDSVRKIKNDTLFVPEYVKYYPLGNGKNKERPIDELFKDYSLPYSVVSISDLNNKILQTKKNMYYMLYIRNTNPTVYIINGLTGEVVYAKKILADELQPDDISKIFKLVTKK